MSDVTISRERLLLLELKAALMPHAVSRGLHPAAVGDLARRAAQTSRFELDAEGEFHERQPIGLWLEELSTQKDASFLFTSERNADTETRPSDAFGGLSREAFEALPARRRLELANAQLDAARRDARKAT